MGSRRLNLVIKIKPFIGDSSFQYDFQLFCTHLDTYTSKHEMHYKLISEEKTLFWDSVSNKVALAIGSCDHQESKLRAVAGVKDF